MMMLMLLFGTWFIQHNIIPWRDPSRQTSLLEPASLLISGLVLSRENAWRIFSIMVIFVLTSAKIEADVRIFTFSLSYFGK